jgi:hypothetical protein
MPAYKTPEVTSLDVFPTMSQSNIWYSSVLCIIFTLLYRLHSFLLLIKINKKTNCFFLPLATHGFQLSNLSCLPPAPFPFRYKWQNIPNSGLFVFIGCTHMFRLLRRHLLHIIVGKTSTLKFSIVLEFFKCSLFIEY